MEEPKTCIWTVTGKQNSGEGGGGGGGGLFYTTSYKLDQSKTIFLL